MRDHNSPYTPPDGYPSSPYFNTDQQQHRGQDAPQYPPLFHPSDIMEQRDQVEYDNYVSQTLGRNRLGPAQHFNPPNSYAPGFAPDPPPPHQYAPPPPTYAQDNMSMASQSGYQTAPQNMSMQSQNSYQTAPQYFTQPESQPFQQGVYQFTQPQFSRLVGENDIITINMPRNFGPEEGNPLTTIPITGTRAALRQLRRAIDDENLIVESLNRDGNKLWELSVRHLIQKGAIADQSAPNDGQGIFALDKMNDGERLAMGLEPEDRYMDPQDSIQNLASPPFRMVDTNPDSFIVFLRQMEKYHSFDKPGIVYQIGVLTRRSEQDYEAQLFPTRPGVKATHTVWLFRDCVGDLQDPSNWVEFWHAFVLRPGAPLPHKEVFQRPVLRHPRDRRFNFEDDSNSYTASKPRNKGKGRASNTSTSISPSTKKKSRWQGSDDYKASSWLDHNALAKDYAHYTDDDLLDGVVSPEKVTGEVLLRLALTHSNKDMGIRLSRARKMHRLRPWKDPTNHVWQNVKKHLNGRPEGFSAAKKMLDMARKGRGFDVRNLTNQKRQETARKSQATKLSNASGGVVAAGGKRKRRSGEDDIKEESDTEERAIMPMKRSTRARKRVDYVKTEHGSDFEDEMDEDTAPLAKRARQIQFFQDNGLDAEFKDEEDDEDF